MDRKWRQIKVEIYFRISLKKIAAPQNTNTIFFKM